METSNTTAVGPLDYAGADTYRERTPGLRRDFILTGDRLVIRAKKLFGSEWEVPIALHNVDPIYSRILRRSESALNGALAFTALCGALLFLLLRDRDRTFGTIPIVVDCVLGLTSLAMAIRYLRRFEFFIFGLSGGLRFDIGKAGPDRDRFDAFVARIVDRVNELRSARATNGQSDHRGVDVAPNEQPQATPASTAPPLA